MKHYGDGLFDDELMAHMPEHSIELEVVFLQYLFEGKRPIRIVPLVVGSFQDAVAERAAPAEREDVRRMVEALRAAERETKEPICYSSAATWPTSAPSSATTCPAEPARSWTTAGRRTRRSCGRRTRPIRPAISASSPRRTTAAASAVCRRRTRCWRRCGPVRARCLHYDQYVHPRGYESVSFASVAFYR